MRILPDGAAASIRSFLSRTGSFALVGLIAFVVDLGVYNLLRFTLLEDKPIGAKVISVAVATVVAWIGNRTLTFRDTRNRPVLHEAALFAVANLLGLGTSALCLFVSHYVLGFTSTLADNISGNVIGLALGTVVRYIAYRYVVFRPKTPDSVVAAASAADPVTATAVVAPAAVADIDTAPPSLRPTPSPVTSEVSA
ncbi:MAG: GtrA family protein [Naasia sp.]